MKKHFCVFIVLPILILIILPVSAEIQTISPGATVFIGEMGLDVSRAVGSSTSIAWWAPGTNNQASAPAQVLPIGGYGADFAIRDSEFTGRLGNWYQYDPAKPTMAGRLAFRVADPSLDIRIVNMDTNGDVTGKTVSPGSHLDFRILTNTYAAFDPLQRPNVNPVTDGFITISLMDETGMKYQNLFGASAVSHPLANISVSSADSAWSGTVQNSWYTDSTSGSNTRRYPYGTYSSSARSSLNGMNYYYKNGGADYIGKTVSGTKAVILLSPNPVIVKETGVSLVEQAAQEKAARAAHGTPSYPHVVPPIEDRPSDIIPLVNKSAMEAVLVDDIHDLLTRWNQQHNWGYSPAQIDAYSKKMEEGNLKQYLVTSGSHELRFPNNSIFYLEVGNGLGFSREQSEQLRKSNDERALRYWQTGETVQNVTRNSAPAGDHVLPSPPVTSIYADPHPDNLTNISTAPYQDIFLMNDLLNKVAALFHDT